MILHSKGKQLCLQSPKVMGILNVTPDSFSDGGRFCERDKAFRQAEQLLNFGADILDIGGESTRPGAEKVSLDEELSRVIPIIEKLRERFDCWISIDTYKPKVMEEAVKVGADMINDVCALQQSGAIETAARLQVPVCLMHMQGTPKTMQKNPTYNNLLMDMDVFFEKQISKCINAGILKENLLLDPGFGFGKSLDDNYELLSKLPSFQKYNLPLLVGLSRKSMLFRVLSKHHDDILGASIAGAVIAVMKGASIVRVHDVKETVDALKIIQQIK